MSPIKKRQTRSPNKVHTSNSCFCQAEPVIKYESHSIQAIHEYEGVHIYVDNQFCGYIEAFLQDERFKDLHSFLSQFDTFMRLRPQR